MNYIFYSIIGTHEVQTVEEIIERKQQEIASSVKYSLWAARIDKKSKEQVWHLNKDDNVIVLCSVSEKAADPVDKQKTDRAEFMVGPEGRSVVPYDINATFTKGKKYQAYVVKNYEILDTTESFDFGAYETLLSDNTIKTFKERFEGFSRFQNTFGKKNLHLKESYMKDIRVRMELQYPFVVDIE